MELEDILLQYEDEKKFEIPFNEYVELDKCLDNVETITNSFFYLMDEYKSHLNKQEMKHEERNKKIEEYQEKLLNESIDFDMTPYEKLIAKIR